MRTFVVEPLSGIRGSIQFGMSRDQVIVSLSPEPPSSFFRGKTLFDGFYESVLQVSYDELGKAEFIEFAQGCSVLLDDFDLVNSDANSVIKHLESLYGSVISDEEPGYSFCFPTIEMNLWRSVIPENALDESGHFFESVGCGRAGYCSQNAG